MTLKQMKRKHDAIVKKGRLLYEEIQKCADEVDAFRKEIEAADPDGYDGVWLIFNGTFDEK